MNEINWNKICSYYNSIKSLYIDCEETDPELKTNLQPLNEFRAALDHLIRINAIEHLDISEYPNVNAEEEASKLLGHFKRAFYDICDMLSINYRNKIIDILEKYDTETISKAIPDYYPSIRPDIEIISSNIAELRKEKGFSKINSEERIEKYKVIIDKLRNYYKKINSSIPSLEEIHKDGKKKKAFDTASKLLIPIITLLISTIIAIIGLKFQSFLLH